MSEQTPHFVLPQPEVPWWRARARALRRALIRRRLERAPLDRKKALNSQLNWREFWHGAVTLDSYPRIVQVGTNWTCNLRCAFCRLTMPWTRDEIRKKPAAELQLSPKVFEVVKRLLPYAEMMTLTPLGEPLQWSGLGDMLDYHARAGSHNLALTSNGMLLDDRMAERLVRGQLSALYLSVDSSDPEVYASMRVGGELRRVEEGIRRVAAWKERLRSPWPALTINATFMERNIGQLPSMVAWAKALGCEALSVQLMEMENPELEAEFLGRHPAAAHAALAEALREGERLGFRVLPHPALTSLIQAAEEGRNVAAHQYTAASPLMPEELKQSAERGGRSAEKEGGAEGGEGAKALVEKCFYPWYNLLIDTDGEARPCCWADVSWGNLNRSEFGEIWNSPKARGMRQAFLKNSIPAACQKRHCRVDL